MKVNKNIILFIFVSMFAFFFKGCVAYFRAGNIPTIPTWPIKTKKDKKSVEIIFKKEFLINHSRSAYPMTVDRAGVGVIMPKYVDIVKLWREQAIEAYKQSGLFKEEIGLYEADFHIEIELVTLKNFDFLEDYQRNVNYLLISLATGCIIPYRGAYDKYSAKVTIRDNTNNMLGTFIQSEEVKEWGHLSFIFISPFITESSVLEETFFEINRAIIYQAYTKGIF